MFEVTNYHSSYAHRVNTVVVVLLLFSGLTRVSEALAQTEDPPEGIEQLLPRGAIPAIFDPQFVTADAADLPDSAWVLGVYINGEARAYDLNLFNHHEVVNDFIGGKPVAAVW
jgi:hypothetical protein